MEEASRSSSQRWLSFTGAAFGLSLLVGAFIIARINLRKGRGDRSGAIRVAAAVFAIEMSIHLMLGGPLMMQTFSLNQLFNRTAVPLTLAALIWGLYLALEPFVRRYWPDSLISWTRLLSGRVRDPRVGRDVLLGCTFGVALLIVAWGHNLLPLIVGQPALPPGLPNSAYLDGGANAIALMARYSVLTLLEGLAIIFGVVVLRVLVRRVWLAGVLAIALFSINSIAMLLGGQGATLDIAASLLGTCIVVFVVVRLGVLVLLVGFLVAFLLSKAPLTADPGRWYFGTSSMLVLVCAAIAICGFVWARAGEPLFGRRLLD